MLKALEKVGLTEGDVEFAIVPVQNVTQELEEGRIDAGHIYQPYTTNALKKGYQILFGNWKYTRHYNRRPCISLRCYTAKTSGYSGCNKIYYRSSKLL